MSKRTRGRKPLKLSWNIQHSSPSYFLGQGIESSRFVVESLGPISWCLVFCPGGYENQKYIACFLKRCGGLHNREIDVDLEMCFKSENGAENFLKTSSNLLFKNDGDSLGFPEFVTREELERCPCPNGVLTVQCYISNNKESNYICDLLSLSNDMKLLYDEKYFYDVLIRVGNSELKVHKTLLNARAPHLVSLIEQNSYEDSIPFIVIPDFSPAIVKEVLYFIYTGDLTENRFLLGKLKNFALKYNLENLLMKLTKSTFDDCAVSTEINMVSISHPLYLLNKMLHISGQQTMIFNLPDSMGSGKIVLQYFVSESDMDCISVKVEISHEGKAKGIFSLLLKFKGSLICGDQIFGESCECASTIVNCAEPVTTIRFSHLFQKNLLPLNIQDIGRTSYMQCDLNLSDSPNSTKTISSESNALTCFSDELYSLYTRGIDTDLVLKTADNKAFNVHKAIICGRVPSIMAMFKGDTQAVNGYVHDDLKNLQVEIPSMDSKMFTDILEYIYSGKVVRTSMDEIVRLRPESVPVYMKAMQEKNWGKLNSILGKKRRKLIKFPSERSTQ